MNAVPTSARSGSGAGRPQSLARKPLRMLLRRAGQAYLAGPDLRDALATARTLDGLGVGSVLAYWHRDDDRPEDVAATSLRAVAASRGLRDSELAVKTPALGHDRVLVSRIAAACRDDGRRLWFDSHGIDLADPTLELAEAAAAAGTAVGVAIPARWGRSAHDLERMLTAGIAVRFVKGQMRDPQSAPVDVRAAFLSLVEAAAGRAGFVAVATHDVPTLVASLRRLAEAGTPCEAQLLLGLPVSEAVRAARRHGAGVRLYLPYGHPSTVYSPAMLWENRRIAWWLVRDVVRSGHMRARLDVAALTGPAPGAGPGTR